MARLVYPVGISKREIEVTIVPIKTMLSALDNKQTGTVRPVKVGEVPDFVQERDKLCTGMTCWKDGVGCSFDLNPPVLLQAEVGYVIELEQK